MKNPAPALFLCLIASLTAPALLAQRIASNSVSNNEIGLVIGATETPAVGLQRGGSVKLNSSLALGAGYDRLLISRHIALYAGIDFLASPFDVKASFPPADISPQYAYLFLTPHVRVKWNANGAWQPWLLFGGGYADFAPKQPRAGNINVTGAGSTGALEFGGGLDTKPLLRLKSIPVVKHLPVGARFEVLDFYSGQPNYGTPTSDSQQNNVTIAGGLLLRF